MKAEMMTTLDAISDIRQLAEDLRGSMPDMAARLSRDTQTILEGMGPLPIARIAAALDVSRPTVYGLVDEGYLDATAMGHRKVIEPASVVDILPVVREWQANGAVGGLRPHLRAWFEGEARAARERRRYRDLIKSGYDPDEWPEDAPDAVPVFAPAAASVNAEPGVG
jgi:hypothetical protein